jgi:hypothetical protein
MKTITEKEWYKAKNYTGIVKFTNGDVFYLKNSKWHREDGPAIIHNSGYKAWRFEGLLHNLNGPAEILSDGTKRYWINGKLIEDCTSDEAFFLYLDMLKLKKIL